MDINIYDDVDAVVNSINDQTEKLENFKADNINEFPETQQLYDEGSNTIKQVYDFGENVINVVDKTSDEIGRVMLGGLGQVADKFIGLIDNIDDLIDSPLEQMARERYGYERGFLNAGGIQEAIGSANIPTADMTVNQWYQNNFEPQTKIGKLLLPVAAEIEGFVLNNLLLKKMGMSIPAASSNKWKKWGVDVLRWATAEGAVGFTMAEDQPSAMLMITDLLGITDENFLPEVRETYINLLENKTPENEFKIRMMNTVDRFGLGAVGEVFVKFLFSIYGPMLGSGFIPTISLNNQIKENFKDLRIE